MPLVSKPFGDIVTFTRASTATFTGSNGLIQSAATNAPRFDYDPVTLAAKGLLIEEQRTNLTTYSEDLANAVWATLRASVSSNVSTAPNGTLTADKLVEDTTASNTHAVLSFADITVVNATQYTSTIYAKAGERSWIQLQEGQGVTAGAYFNVSAGTVGTVSGTGSPTASIRNEGNGWYRCSLTWTASGVAARIRVFLANGDNGAIYTGDGTSGAFIWGAQLEAGSFATSYIPTVASQVTRSADVASVNTLSPWYNATEGTIFADYEQNSSTQSGGSLFVQSDGTNNNRILLTADGASSGTIQPGLYVTDASVPQVAIVAGTGTVNSLNKIAAAYKANDFAASFNGAAAVPDTSGTVPVVNLAYIGVGATGTSGHINGHIRRITYYPRRLSNAELQAITA